MRTVKVAPAPRLERTVSVPPMSSTMSLAIDRPRPVPDLCDAAVAAEEALEHAVQLVVRDPRPLVGDGDHDVVVAVAVALGGQADGRPSRPGVRT